MICSPDAIRFCKLFLRYLDEGPKMQRFLQRYRLLLALLGWPSLLLAGEASGWRFIAQQTPSIVVVNAASFTDAGRVAPEELVSAFGQFKSLNDQPTAAMSLPLPTTLGGIKVKVGVADAALLFVSTTQINFLIPAAVSTGQISLVVTNADGSILNETIQVTAVSPGIFTTLSDGRGTAAAQTTFDGVNLTPVAAPDGSALTIEAGTHERPNYLILYATGLRRAPASHPDDTDGVAEAVTATVQGIPVPVLYAGPQPGFAGLDQVNLVLPPQAAGFGEVQARLIVAGQPVNTVRLRIGGDVFPAASLPITIGQTVTGSLAIEDAAQNADGGRGRSFFYDAWRFTAPAGTTLAIDLRSEQFDASILLYRLLPDGGRVFIASDDQTGGIGDGKIENNNALLLTALLTAGDYLIFATSSDVEANALGRYSLMLRSVTIPRLEYGASITEGAITNADVQTSAGVYLKAWWFAGTRNDGVRISCDSAVFDPFLVLNLFGAPFALNDTADALTGGLNALIERTLPEDGVYLILITPFATGRTGSFTLTLARTN
jgi:uncharacterized protein (TIGR03437 family)